jgi:glucosamine--fructose-6-phosphate aminotransferase (isomerizing)
MERCAQCLLPSSLEDSDFDDSGICSWCRAGYPYYAPKGADALRELLETERDDSGSADCLVGVSGGKDSSYVAMQLKTVFGIRVEAFTYIHDGSTPSAVKNARDVCARLGIKQHEISLPNHQHLESFRSFFRSWLKSPNTTTAAMICVACKHLHIMGTRLAASRGIPMIVWSMCPLESSPFIAIKLKGKKGDDFAREGMLKSAGKLVGAMIRSPHFAGSVMKHFPLCVNGCLAFVPGTRYLKMRYPSVRHVHFFDFCEWDPEDIIATLVKKAGWEPPTNVPDDWHSDCVFNIFKEYMFQKMLGVSYTDGFLSNQIRHGLITREEAWTKLLASKAHYAEALPKALEYVGLNDLAHEIDVSCFEIQEAQN